MKITVDGNVVTIDYDNNPHECKRNCDNIVEECIETQKKPVTYRDEFLKFCKAILEKELKIYSLHESSFFVYNGASFYHVGFDNGHALRLFANKYKQTLDWDNPDTIIEWLDSEVKEANGD
ncbi:MAG: hypothetical protein IJQ99_10095 [Synergistaceae bacterium]|nr:hypothetical protein [Synergistaceae bacterium]